MKIALIDDEAHHVKALREALDASLAELGLAAERIDTFSETGAFFADFEKGKYDIILLDIFMGEMSGIEAARRIRKTDTSVSLAFCTSSNDFASQSYEVEAKYYLQKPISQEKVTAMLSRLHSAGAAKNRTVRLPDGFRIPLRQILYTEYQNHSVAFHLLNGEVHTVYMMQRDAEGLLLEHRGFCAANKGSIVHFAAVSRISGGTFLMKDGCVIPIARRRFKELESAYKQFRFEEMDAEVSD